MWDETEESDRKEDERKQRRWNIPVQVLIKGVQKDGAEFSEETITADASPSGMCVLLPAELRKGDQVTVKAPDEGFESTATVRYVSTLGPGMNRVRVFFPKGTEFNRESASKKYIYDYQLGYWVGYIVDGTYYDSKHVAFGKVEDNKILSLDTGAVHFLLRTGRAFDMRGNCIGYIV